MIHSFAFVVDSLLISVYIFFQDQIQGRYVLNQVSQQCSTPE